MSKLARVKTEERKERCIEVIIQEAEVTQNFHFQLFEEERDHKENLEHQYFKAAENLFYSYQKLEFMVQKKATTECSSFTYQCSSSLSQQ